MFNLLASLSDTKKLEQLGRLHDTGNWRFIATKGTADAIKALGFPCTPVSAVTGCDEVIEGRVKVKTLHHKVFTGITADRSETTDSILERNGITRIDVVLCNFYNFAGDSRIEKIDLAPAVVVAAAKYGDSVLSVVDPDDYGAVVEALCQSNPTLNVPLQLRERLTAKTFAAVAAYYQSIATCFRDRLSAGKPLFQ